MGKKILIWRTAMLLLGLSTLPALFVHCANKGFVSNIKVDPTVNGSVYQPPPGTGGGNNYMCASTVPCSNGVSCSLSIGRPVMENQAWQKDATTCGYTCINGYTGPMCGTSPGGTTFSCQGATPSFANICDGDETGLTTNGTRSLVYVCTPATKCEYTCRPGYNFQDGQCKPSTANSCAANPACANIGCALNTGNPSSPGQAWEYQAANCGYSCINGYTGTNCMTPPTYVCQGTMPSESEPCTGAEGGLTVNTSRVLVDSCSSAKCEYKCKTGFTRQGTTCIQNVANYCATPDPCTNNSNCILTRNANSQNQAWAPNVSSCGYACINGYSGTNCATAPIGGGTTVTKIACTAAVQQLPTATHWSNGIVVGANGQLDLVNPNMLTDRRIYSNNLLPKFNDYIGGRHELQPITNDEWIGWTSAECQGTNMAIEIRKPDSYSDWGISRNALVEGRGSIQLLHALISDSNNLVTLILPPNWKKTDAPGKYPIMFTTSYDLRGNILARNHLIVQSLALAWDQSKPFIGVIWNGGGAVGSRNMNADSKAWFNSIIQKVATHFGGNSQKIFMFGASRGGSSTLMMASNTNSAYPYKIVAAYAGVPPTDFFGTVNFTGATFPGLIAAAEWSIGLLDTWKSSFTYPTSLPGQMGGMNRNQAHLHILTGQTNQATLDNSLSLSSNTNLDGLKTHGARLYIELSSHDLNVPWVLQYKFMRALQARNVPHQLRVNYMAGHWVDTSSSYAILSKTKFAEIMKNIADGNYSSIFSMGSKQYYQNSYNSTSMTSLASGDRFTFEFPHYQTPSTTGHFVLTGPPKTKVRLTFSHNDVTGDPAEAELNDEGILVIPQNEQEPGVFKLAKVELKRDGATAWEAPLDLRNGTTSLDRGNYSFEVKTADPGANTSAVEIFTQMTDSYLGPASNNLGTNGFRDLTYGLCQP